MRDFFYWPLLRNDMCGGCACKFLVGKDSGVLLDWLLIVWEPKYHDKDVKDYTLPTIQITFCNRWFWTSVDSQKSSPLLSRFSSSAPQKPAATKPQSCAHLSNSTSLLSWCCFLPSVTSQLPRQKHHPSAATATSSSNPFGNETATSTDAIAESIEPKASIAGDALTVGTPGTR